MKEHSVSEFQPIRQKYFLHEREKFHQDPLADSLQIYFAMFRKRMICHLFLSLFFLALVIPSIVLQTDFIEVDILPNGGKFNVSEKWNAPISIQIFSKTNILLLDVELFLNNRTIEEFTIQDDLISNTNYTITSNKNFTFTVRLMAQFDYVPTSYLIIMVVMLVLSLLYLILQYARHRTL